MTTLVLLPNQLFGIEIIKRDVQKHNITRIVLCEHPKFFTMFNYHKSKLIFHRATMKAYYDLLSNKLSNKLHNVRIEYVNYYDYDKDIGKDISIYDPVDFAIKKEFKGCLILQTPLFLLNSSEIDAYMKQEHPYHNATFYKYVRRLKDILMHDGKPIGDKWSFDKDNRHKFPAEYAESKLLYVNNKYIVEASAHINKHFPDNIGSGNVIVPITHSGAIKHYREFLEHGIISFGKFQDAIKDNVNVGYHSCISALLNVGLLDVRYVINSLLGVWAKNKDIPIESVEAFIRQLIWREYVRMLYVKEYKTLTTMNFFNSVNKIPKSWYTATTGILPIDVTIQKALDTSYLHHIERLMIIGNFMLLSRFRPKDVYKWFIEVVSIDAYEWVMVPNIYGMSQHSAGTLMMSRPYISSSNYIRKMSNYKRNDIDSKYGDWTIIWDDLYHKFINVHKKYLRKNYATANAAK